MYSVQICSLTSYRTSSTILPCGRDKSYENMRKSAGVEFWFGTERPIMSVLEFKCDKLFFFLLMDYQCHCVENVENSQIRCLLGVFFSFQ